MSEYSPKEWPRVSGEVWPCRAEWLGLSHQRATLLCCSWKMGVLLFSGSSNMDALWSPAVPVYPSALCHLSQHCFFPVARQAAARIPHTPSVSGALAVLSGVFLVN